MRIRPILPVALVVGALLATLSANAEDVRDYYSEPGLHPFKEQQGQDQSENIDPFSGTLQLQYTDIRIPGNGGMDIVIHRSYTNPQKAPGYQNVFGIGWSIGYGRIVVPSEYVGAMCTIANMGNTRHSPSVEHPDGSRELLVYNDIDANGGDGSLITKSNWKANCITPTDYRDGMLVIAPDGTKYTMDVESTVYNSEGSLIETSFYTSEVEDVYGNWIGLEYQTLPNRGISSQKYLTRITAGTSASKGGGQRSADGREVTFEYIDQNDQPISGSSLDARLSAITNHLSGIPDQVWEFEYEEADTVSDLENMYGLELYQLTKVNRPDGTEWTYTYYPEIVAVDDSDSLALASVTYPQGGTVTYDYQQVGFYSWSVALQLTTHSIQTKTTSGSHITSGVWTYEFLPNSYTVSGHPNKADVTNVYRPNGSRERHIHYGHSYSVGYYDLLWPIGLKMREEIYNASNQLVQLTQRQWAKRRISGQWYTQGLENTSGPDRATWAPRLEWEHVSRYDGNENGYTTAYSNYDKFGNPGTTTASRVIASYADKVTQLSYYNNESKWIIGKADTETITGVAGNIDRTFDTFGSVTAENRYGVTTGFTYTNDGDIASITDPEGRITSFSNYYRGVARLESKPVDNIQVVRTVNDSGTVSSYNITANSDARILTKYFTYDELNRLSGIDFPQGSDVAVNWSGATVQTLTRGNYEEKRHFDGFGRVRQLVRRDSSSGGDTLTVNSSYDAFGRRTFESFPNSVKGTSYAYTVIDDIARIDYENGDYRIYQYQNEAQYSVTDGKGNTTYHLDNFYGSPDRERTPYYTQTPVNATITQHNLLNQVTLIFQGQLDSNGSIIGAGREFAYDSRQYLASELHNEIAAVSTNNDFVLYDRDDVGNVVGKTVGDSPTISYQYDDLNRLTLIDYPSTADTTYTYTKTDKPKTITNGTGARTYTYDNNDNLTNELIAIGSNNYSVGYAVDSLDAVSVITYPSGRTLSLSPDALGRPTQVGAYVTAIDYHPSGQWQQLVYGNGQVMATTLDSNRLWIDQIVGNSGSTTTVSLDYGYDVVGNVISIVDGVTPAANRTMTYDGLNRLLTAQGSWGSESITYNGRDDITAKAGKTHAYSSNLLMYTQTSSDVVKHFGYDDKARTIEEWVYDYTWQLLGYQNSYFYDDADNMVSVMRHLNNNLVATYGFEYDGKNNRVQRVHNAGSPTDYVYSDDGVLLGEYPAGSAADGKEYAYLGSQLIASVEPSLLLARASNSGNADSQSLQAITADVDQDGLPLLKQSAASKKATPAPKATTAYDEPRRQSARPAKALPRSPADAARTRVNSGTAAEGVLLQSEPVGRQTNRQN